VRLVLFAENLPISDVPTGVPGSPIVINAVSLSITSAVVYMFLRDGKMVVSSLSYS